jgi:hypothetical protein
MGSGACAHDSQSWSRAALEVPPGALWRPGLVPCALTRSRPRNRWTPSGQGKRGTKVRKDAAVERRYGEAGSQAGPVLLARARPLPAPNGAPLPLMGVKTRSALSLGAQIETQNETRAGHPRRENEDACRFFGLGCLTISDRDDARRCRVNLRCHRPRRRAIQPSFVELAPLTAGCPAFAGHDTEFVCLC